MGWNSHTCLSIGGFLRFSSIIGKVDLIVSTIFITRGIMTSDCYIFYFFENLFKRFFQVNDQIHHWSLHLNLFLVNFHVERFLLKELPELRSLQFTGSNITMPYAEIGVSVNNIYLVWGDCFLSFQILLCSKYCEQMIIDFHQLSYYYNVLCTTTTN